MGACWEVPLRLGGEGEKERVSAHPRRRGRGSVFHLRGNSPNAFDRGRKGREKQ